MTNSRSLASGYCACSLAITSNPEYAAKLQQVLERLPPKAQGRFVAGIEAVVRSVEGRGPGR